MMIRNNHKIAHEYLPHDPDKNTKSFSYKLSTVHTDLLPCNA